MKTNRKLRNEKEAREAGWKKKKRVKGAIRLVARRATLAYKGLARERKKACLLRCLRNNRV
jgi:hypothetical protein